jgi:hypothetical protein
MSGVISALRKFFTKDRTVFLVLFVALCVFVLYYSSGKSNVMDAMDVGTTATTNVAQPSAEAPSASAASAAATAGSGSSYSAQSTAQPTDLLPQDHNEQWASINPSSQNAPNTPDLLKAGEHYGTVSQVNKNANLQLRADPCISKVDTGPWNQSTIECDTMRRPLEN